MKRSLFSLLIFISSAVGGILSIKDSDTRVFRPSVLLLSSALLSVLPFASSNMSVRDLGDLSSRLGMSRSK